MEVDFLAIVGLKFITAAWKPVNIFLREVKEASGGVTRGLVGRVAIIDKVSLKSEGQS